MANVLPPVDSPDEKRAAQLKDQLLAVSQNMTTSSDHIPTSTGSGGGIFCQIEAQFRAQQVLASKTHIRYIHPLLLAMVVTKTGNKMLHFWFFLQKKLI